MMEASDNQISTFDGHGPGGRVVACTKKPASKRLACCVDQTHKFSNLLEDIRKVDRFAQYIESQENGNLTEMEGSQMKSSKM